MEAPVVAGLKSMSRAACKPEETNPAKNKVIAISVLIVEKGVRLLFCRLFYGTSTRQTSYSYEVGRGFHLAAHRVQVRTEG